jgi:hypothetical protein
MTVWIYVDTRKQVGSSPIKIPRDSGSASTTGRVLPSSIL